MKASGALPPVLPMVKIGADHDWDGGIVSNTMDSSRTRDNTDVFRRIHNWQVALYQALCKVPEQGLPDRERELKVRLSRLPDIAILHVIYQHKAYEGHAKDCEFSGRSMREHWQSSLRGYQAHAQASEVAENAGAGIAVHDVHREED